MKFTTAAIACAAVACLQAAPAQAAEVVSGNSVAGTVFDSLTGLTWQTTKDFAGAAADGWRLATEDELRQLFLHEGIVERDVQSSTPYAPAGVHALDNIPVAVMPDTFVFATFGLVGTSSSGAGLITPSSDMKLGGFYSEQYANSFTGSGGRTTVYWEHQVFLVDAVGSFTDTQNPSLPWLQQSLVETATGSKVQDSSFIYGGGFWWRLQQAGVQANGLPDVGYYMVRAVPEPGSVAMLLLGLAATAGLVRKSRLG